MIERLLFDKLFKSLKTFPIVGLIGSRQVGKTTLAKEIQKKYPKNSIYLDLELPSDLNKLKDAELFLKGYENSLVIIDEIQRKPDLFPLLRALVDQNRKPGRFLILGSASPTMIKRSSESLAGRIIYLELNPLNIFEINQEKAGINELWLKGGYPQSYLLDEEDSFNWRQAFVQTYLERDIPQLGISIPAPQLRRFWTMIGHSHGQLWNASQISRSLGVSAPTVTHYLNLLEDIFLIRRLSPFYLNIKKRLVKSPKIYIRDSGILHCLLNQSNFENLQGYPLVGNSWEGFVIEQVVSCLPDFVEIYFYRTAAGAELDLVILIPNQSPMAIEIKYSLHPKLSRGFFHGFSDLGCRKGYVIYPGEESYPLAENIFTLPLKHIPKIFSLSI